MKAIILIITLMTLLSLAIVLETQSQVNNIKTKILKLNTNTNR